MSGFLLTFLAYEQDPYDFVFGSPPVSGWVAIALFLLAGISLLLAKRYKR